MSIKIDFVNKLLEQWREAGRVLSRLLMFVSLNMAALRKIVKKQNKLVRHCARRRPGHRLCIQLSAFHHAHICLRTCTCAQ
jgi:predicted  nucleic acid-binding Zn ribbon protein